MKLTGRGHLLQREDKDDPDKAAPQTRLLPERGCSQDEAAPDKAAAAEAAPWTGPLPDRASPRLAPPARPLAAGPRPRAARLLVAGLWLSGGEAARCGEAAGSEAAGSEAPGGEAVHRGTAAYD